MKTHTIGAVALAVGILLVGGVSFGQEAEVPLTWEGDGEATIIGRDGQEEIKFDLKFHIDEDGVVSGSTSTGDGAAEIERFYYGDPVKSESPALDSRKLILALSIESSDTPILVIMNGQVLGEKYFYGEIRLTRLNAEGMKEGLNIGNKTATSLSAEGFPSGVKKALEKSVPMGYFEVQGKRAAESK